MEINYMPTQPRNQHWWDLHFIGMAQYASNASKDPSTKVGCVIVNDKRRIVSLGYNGLPRGIDDSDERLNNRDTKIKIMIHAEKNAMHFANCNLEGCTIYTWPFMPCAGCASAIIQEGIKRVVTYKIENERWQADFDLAVELFKESGVELVYL